LLGHAHLETTAIYTHITELSTASIPSPLEVPRVVAPSSSET